MKLFKTILAMTILGLAGISSAQAHGGGNVGWSISIGSPYYAPPPVYYAAPPVVYYDAPVVYYRSAPPVVYSPYASFSYFGTGGRHRDWDRHEWRERRHDWGRGGWRGHGHHDDDD